MKRSLVFIGLSFMFLVSITGLKAQDNNTLFTIDGKGVSVEEFKHIYEKNKDIGENKNEDLDDYLDKFIKFKLKVQEAKDLGMDTTASFKKEFSGYRKQLADPYFVDESIIDQLVQEAIERKKTDLRASHILIKVSKNAMPEDTLKAFQKALSVRKEILKGMDFGEAAVKYSDDPSAKDRKGRGGRIIKGNKGDLGYFTALDMVYPFENAAYALKVGEISMPVRTVFGYHIIKLTDRSPASGTIKIAHLFLKVPANADAQDSLNVKKTADSLYNVLKKGGNFEELVKQFSDDKGSVPNGGELPAFPVNRMIPEFIKEIKKMSDSGQITRPILSPYGWHIVKLYHKTGFQKLSDEEKKKLEEKIRKDSRSQKSKEVVIDEIKKEYGYKEYTKNLKDIYPLIDSAILTKKWAPKTGKKLTKKLFTIGDKTYTQQDFIKYLSDNQAVRKGESFAEFVNRSFRDFSDKMCIAYEDARLEQKHPEFRMLTEEYRDGILLFDLMDKKVWTKANKDTTGLKAYYEKHKKDFMWGERVKAQLFIIYKNDKMDDIYNAAKNGKTKDEIEKEFNQEEGTQSAVRIIEKVYSKGDEDIIDQVKWETGVSGIKDYKGKKAFVRILEVLKPEPKKFKEARGLVVAAYQDYLKDKWEKELAAKYKVKINKKALKSLRKELK